MSVSAEIDEGPYEHFVSTMDGLIRRLPIELLGWSPPEDRKWHTYQNDQLVFGNGAHCWMTVCIGSDHGKIPGIEQTIQGFGSLAF
jgi:hypothetical protein